MGNGLSKYAERNKKVAEANSRNIAGRFWKKVQKGPGCWLWIGSRNANGYGRIMVAGKRLQAHRVSYELAFGKPLPGILVCHRCDNPQCVNPSHLFVGTSGDNVHDAIIKGRIKPRPHTEDTKRKIAEWHRGRTISQETREKIGAANRGKKRGPLSLEHRMRISEYKRLWWQQSRLWSQATK